MSIYTSIIFYSSIITPHFTTPPPHRPSINNVLCHLQSIEHHSTATATTVGTGPVPSRLAWRLHLDVPHVYLLVHQQHRRPLSLLPPVLRLGRLVDVHDRHLSTVVLDPIPSPLVHKSHEITPAVVFMVSIGPMVVIAFVKNDANQPELSSWLRILQRLKPKLMINIPRKQDMVQIQIIHLILPQRLIIYLKIYILLTLY